MSAMLVDVLFRRFRARVVDRPQRLQLEDINKLYHGNRQTVPWLRSTLEAML